MANIKMQYILWGKKSVYDSWLAGVKEEFRTLGGINDLKAQVIELKKRKMQKQAIAMDDYRVLKGYLQQRWMEHFEGKLVDELEEVINRPEVVKENCLIVIVLPEAMISDYEIENEQNESGDTKKRTELYVNPLYEETVRKFLGKSYLDIDAQENTSQGGGASKTLLQFTKDHPQVLLFAGTVWWKQWKEGYPKGVIFNSAPVFYKGRCCLLWDKQYISEMDGLSEDNLKNQWIAYRINEMRIAEAGVDAIYKMDPLLDRYYAANKEGILSSLTRGYNMAHTPLLEFVCPSGESLVFGIDICKDNSCIDVDRSKNEIVLERRIAPEPCSLAEYLGKKAAPVNVLKADGSYSVSTGREREIDISVIMANWLCDIYSSPKYHICKADALDEGATMSSLTVMQSGRAVTQSLTAWDDKFFLLSNVVSTEQEGQQGGMRPHL